MDKKMIFAVGLVTVLLLSSISVSGDIIKNKNEEKSSTDAKDWTLMFYCGGDEYGPGEGGNRGKIIEFLINLIINLPYKNNDNINVIALLDYSNHEYLLKLEKNSGSWSKLTKLPLKHIFHDTSQEINMGDEDTLKIFLNYCKENFPADRYFLEFIGHGGGFTGVIIDSDVGTGYDWLSLEEVKNAIKQSIGKLDIFFLCSCNMGNLETVYELRDITEVFVVSEEITLPSGVLWNILNVFNKYYNEDNIAISKKLIEGLKENAPNYLNFIQNIAGYSDFDLTWSAIDTSKLNQFKYWINNLCSRLIGYLEDDNETIKQKVIETREELKYVGPGVDLYNFCKVLKEKLNDNDLKYNCQVIMNSINWKVVISKFHQNEGRTNGLSIFFPYNIHNYSKNNISNSLDQTYRWINDSINESFELSFTADTLWDEFLIEMGKDE